MPESRYARAGAIVHEVLELDPAERAARLDQLCAEDADLRAEADWLIHAADDEALDVVPEVVNAAANALAAEWRVEATIPGNYQLIEPIGEGGMGVVWLAERTVGGARQQVALKRLHSGTMTHHARLIEEQRILATLTHPNIARLLDAGVDRDGVPFLAMEYVAGVRIDHWCHSRNLDLRARLSLFLQTCKAVSHAHQQLVIHRDLKPANVLVGRDGVPKLLDFGIARLIDAEAAQHTATRLMTPAYASPEQLEGQPLGTATDVWSLGVVLHELLTGVRPMRHYDSEHARALAMLSGGSTSSAQSAPSSGPGAGPPVRALRIPDDVDAIVQKALRREPEQRYGSVRELAEDLQRFLDARPVLARRGRWTYHTRRFMQRNRWPIAAGLAALALVAGFIWRLALAEREARLQASVADRTTEFLISAFALSDPTQAGRHDYSAREVLDRGLQRVDSELGDLPQVRARLLEALGNAYRGINEGTAGAALLEAAAQLHLDAAVADPLAAARSLQGKAASILASNGSTLDAEDAARRAFALVQTHAADDPLRMAEAHAALAYALDSVSKESLAIRAAQTALDLRVTAGADTSLIAQSHVDLCYVASGSGDHATALGHCERALALYSDRSATPTNGYRMALRQLERTLVYSGQYERGLRIARERIALTEKLFGAHSSVLAAERLSMTDRLAEAGLFDEARQLIELGMPVILERNGTRSTQYAKALFHTGWLEALQGRHAQALPSMREALAIHEGLVEGRDRGMLQVLRTTLAQVLIESGQANAEARALLDAVIAERSEGDANPIGLAYARLPLAQWHAARGEGAAARLLLDQVEAVGASVEQEVHARAAATRATILLDEGDTAGAVLQAQAAYAMMRADRGPTNPRTIRYAVAYARILAVSGDREAARTLQSEYLPLLAAVFPPDSTYRMQLP
ncbi:MAG: serine/threonine-protein kinase [Xanthomonadales bacterium]|jgi:serine/threonine-protein kinase|nr:serine/threonine-protein kinase [Xanthomonadales bacterium]